jgi:Fur family ferric uptake transcriptional regulator
MNAMIDEISAARKALMEYLKSRKFRIIPKRFDILQHIYAGERGHFTVEELYEYLLSHGCKVSKATVYNTIDLLIDAQLLQKSQFPDSAAVYEKISKKLHYHCICKVCGTIRDLQDDGVMKTAVMTRRITKFKQTDFSLCIYGVCRDCEKKELKNIIL